MRVTILYLGGSRVQAGCAEQQLELADRATIADVADQVCRLHPSLAPLLDSCRWAQNFELATPTQPLADGDEIALLPPVAGGSPRTWITSEPLDATALLDAVAGPDIGATVLFVGTVRDQTRGQRVERLAYEAYVPMVERTLDRIARTCETEFPGSRLAIGHRYGDLAVGDISVVIAAAAPHRDAAYDANRRAIELIKQDVPIWKREVTADGEVWVGWGGG